MSKQQNIPAHGNPQRAREAAQAAAAIAPQEPTSLVSFSSRGAVLILGDGEGAWAAAAIDELRERMPQLAFIGPNPPAWSRQYPEVTVYTGEVIGLEGHLGQWRPQLSAQTAPAVSAAVERAGAFDLVLDLLPQPLIRRSMLPFGYFAPGDEAALRQALDSLPELTGEFEKPRYFNFDPLRCAHANSGLTGCTRCIEVCPAQAIRSIAGRISVDPNLCQGGGTCASACPGGAISYAFPNLRDSLNSIRRMLGAYFEAGGERPSLLFHDAAAGLCGAPADPRLLPIEVEELGSVGMDTWLAALAYGAEQVLLLSSHETPPETVALLDEQIGYARALLAAMGYAPAIRRIRREELEQAVPAEAPSAHAPARMLLLGDKREVIRAALAHLHAQALLPIPLVELAPGAPFGAVAVDGSRCTLCLACVSVCPAGALRDGGDRPRLDLVEQNCLQCGLCRQACPEQAISLIPRYLFEPSAATPRTLHQEEPLCCGECGKPYATASVIARVRGLLAQHPLFQDEAARRRLSLCEDCRVRDLLRDELRQAR